MVSQYVALDGVMCRFLSSRLGGELSSRAVSLSGYAALIGEIQKAFPGKQFVEISRQAWEEKKNAINYWILALGEGWSWVRSSFAERPRVKQRLLLAVGGLMNWM